MEWPLPAGSSWIAYVLRNNVRNANGGFVTIAQSAAFTITEGSGSGTEEALRAARLDIETMIMGQNGNQKLAAKFLRLGFHDCIGGCDGCVDLSNPENGGLLVPINALRPIVNTYANAVTGISRADIYALATAVGADVLQSKSNINFDMTLVGRVDCENANTVCHNEHGVQHNCNETLGPNRFIPGMNTNSRQLFNFFFNEFGFSTREGVALMGAHTIGELKSENTGVNGPNGWMRNNDKFDNGKSFFLHAMYSPCEVFLHENNHRILP